MTAKTIFYSWQSDVDEKTHHYLIRDCLKNALKALGRDLNIELSLDKDTRKVSGSPDIVDTIFRKIRAADIFVADVTVINKDFEGRKNPNPNVLIELGYAIRTLGWERIICVIDTGESRPEDLPFDIRNNRISKYQVDGDIKAAEKSLTGTLTVALKSIIEDYDGIMERFRKDDYLDHDKELLKKLNEICSQIQLQDSLDFTCTSLSVNQTYYRLWRTVKSWGLALENHFLDSEIQEGFEAFGVSLAKFHLYATQQLFSENRPDMLYESDYRTKGIEITPELQFEIDQTHWYRFPDFFDLRSDDIEAYNRRRFDTQDEFNKLADEVMTAYQGFRLAVKRQLLI